MLLRRRLTAPKYLRGGKDPKLSESSINLNLETNRCRNNGQAVSTEGMILTHPPRLSENDPFEFPSLVVLGGDQQQTVELHTLVESQ